MALPRRIRPLTSGELELLSVERLKAYRKKLLSLENCLAKSDYTDLVDTLDPNSIWFKDDPRWQALYDAVLEALARKQNQ